MAIVNTLAFLPYAGRCFHAQSFMGADMVVFPTIAIQPGLYLLLHTAPLELKEILQSSDRLLQDDIGQLRKYHLCAFGEDLPGGARIVVPSTLTLVTDIIRERVRDPKRLEGKCSKATRTTPQLISEVGDAIRRVMALLLDKKYPEAVDLATITDRNYPNNPDVKCLLGRACLKVGDAAQAEIAFRAAFHLNCQRPELPNLWFKAKSFLEDWIGAIEITQLFPETAEMIVFRARSYAELGNMDLRSGNLRRASERWLSSGRAANDAFKTFRARGREVELNHIRRFAYENYVAAVNALIKDSDERIGVWKAATEAFDSFVRHASVMQLGVEALQQWWNAVEKRPNTDNNAKKLAYLQLKKLQSMYQDIVIQRDPDSELTTYLSASHQALLQRVNRYGEEL